MKIAIFLLLFVPILVLSQSNRASLVSNGGGEVTNGFKNFSAIGEPMIGTTTNLSKTNHGGFLKASAASIPALDSTILSNLGISHVDGQSEVLNHGGDSILRRGFCWSLAPTPTISNDTVVEGPGMGVFLKTIYSLSPLTTYYVRSYAINSAGVGYGEEKSFTTLAFIQARRIVWTSISQYQLGLKWTRGNGDSCLVAIKKITPFSTTPLLDGTFYNVSQYYGQGSNINNGFGLYKGTDSTATAKNLTKGTLYFFRVFEFYNNLGTNYYSQEITSYNPNSKTTSKKEGESENTNLNDFSMAFSPNPASNFISLKLISPINQIVNMKIVDATGKTCLELFDNYNIIEGENNINIDLSNLSSGMYSLVMTNDENFAFDNFVVQK